MKQVVDMLSKEVVLNEKLLTEPGVYRPFNSGRSGRGGSSSREKLSSQTNEDKQPGNPNPDVSSAQFDSSHSPTQMLPR